MQMEIITIILTLMFANESFKNELQLSFIAIF